MTNIPIQKAEAEQKAELPVFAELEKRMAEIQRRAFERFEARGGAPGRDLEDWLNAEREIAGWLPEAEVKENEHGYEVNIRLPGFEAKDVEVTATPEEVAVHAKAEHEEKSEKGEVVWTEFGSNEVYRRVAFPGAADVNRATARLERGLLHVHAPKAAGDEPKKVSAAA